MGGCVGRGNGGEQWENERSGKGEKVEVGEGEGEE